MTKAELQSVIKDWINNFLNNQTDFRVINVFEDFNAAKSNEPLLKITPKIEKCDFSVDFFVLIENDKGERDFILINRYAKSVGLRAIGEMLVYASVADPYASFIISSLGHSSEINNLLLNPEISSKLFTYKEGKSVIMFTIDTNAVVSKTSILPLAVRSYFSG